MLKSFKIFVFFALFLSLAKSLEQYDSKKITFTPKTKETYSNGPISNDDEIIIDFVCEEEKMIIGSNGVLHFKTNFNDTSKFDLSTLEKDSLISTFVNEYYSYYNATCRLWISSDNRISLFCNLFNENLETGERYIDIEDRSFRNNNNNFRIYFPHNIFVEQLDYSIPFLYADPQIINVDESQTLYELKFKILNFTDGDILYIHGTKYNYAALENCKRNIQEMKCELTKEKIEQILILQNEKFEIGAMNDNYGLIKFSHVYDINITYNNVTRETISIKLEKLVGGITESGTPYAFETNITSIPNFISDLHNETLYFKKMPEKPLMMFFEGEDISYYEDGLTLENLHYKYIFIIERFKLNDTILIDYDGTNVLLAYPEKLNLISTNSTIIRYIMADPTLATGIKLDNNSESDLECDDLNMMKKCTVPISHFKEKKSGYFNTYHLNHKGNYNIYYNSPSIFISLSKDDYIELYIEDADNTKYQAIGINGIINLVINYNDSVTNLFNASDLEENSAFNTTIITDKNEKAEVTCRLWKPIDEKLNMFCKLYTTFSPNRYNYKISSGSFKYKDKYINIISHASELRFEQVDEVIPFLYSSKQVLNIEETTDIYELKYNIVEYHGETLFIPFEKDSFIFDKCSVEGKELICKITKEEIEEIAYYNGLKYDIFLYRPNSSVKSTLGLSFSNYGFYINYPLKKKDIYVKITKLLTSEVDSNDLITYETNVSNISNVNSDGFDLDLTNETNIRCLLKKTENMPLLMNCKVFGKEIFSLGEIKNRIELNNINIKYNFYIEPVINEEICKIGGESADIIATFPKSLDFTLNDSLTIDYLMIKENFKGIKLNPNEKELQCIDIEDGKRCTVHKSHFFNKISGYYYTYQLNYLNNYVPYYGISPIKVTLPKEITLSIKEINNKNEIKIGRNGGAFALVTDYNDNGNKLFKDNDNITFIGTFQGINAEYELNCKLWTPNDDYVRIICNMENELTNLTQMLILNSTSFTYNNYTIFVEQDQELLYKQYKEIIPFLYSDEQMIKMNDNTSSYELIFKYEVFENNQLYIYGSNNNYALLDNCQKNGNKINCIIAKEKLEEILTSQDERFKIGTFNDYIGVISLDHILDIIINYENVQREEIYFKILKTIGGITEVGTPFAYETNITEFPSFISKVFNDKGGYFRKIKGRPLLMFTNMTMERTHKETVNFTEEIIENNSHYKYIFRIQPSTFEDEFSIQGIGTDIFLAYPQKIDFVSSNETSIIRFIGNNPELMENLKLNPDSESYLVCENLDKMKKCQVPPEHFANKSSGQYSIYHKNHLGDSNIYYDAPLINLTVPEKENITDIYIKPEDNPRTKYIGYEGTVNFVLDFNDTITNIFNSSDIEEKTIFNTTINVDNSTIVDVNCKLWKPIDEKLNMFCKLRSNLTFGEHSFNLNSNSFKYNNKIFNIIQNGGLSLSQLNETLPFLYSSKQVLNINENTNIYYLTFKIGDYHNEPLMIPVDKFFSIILLDECSVEGKKLKCKIEKDTIEEYISYNGQKLSVYHTFPHCKEKVDMDDFYIYSIYEIYINYPLIKKEISVEIVQLLEDKIEIFNYITYETNIKNNTNITNVHTLLFSLKTLEGKTIDCSFKKTKETSLLMICLAEIEGEFSLGQVANQTELNNINIKYNFIIEPINNNETCTISGFGSKMLLSLPKKLDFINNEQIIVDFAMMFPENSKSIRFNPEANDLDCNDINEYYKRCTVHKSHFNNNGYYYTYHKNQDNKYIKFYEFSPLEVILTDNKINILIKKENNENNIIIGNENYFALVTDFNNKEKKIFENNANISFVGTFINQKRTQFKANCKFWIPKDDNLRIICKFIDNFYPSPSEMYLDKYEFNYINYTIIIEQNEEIEFEKYYRNIPFLYSDKQTININDSIPLYELKFNIEAFNKSLLYIYGSNDNYAILDNCQSDDQKLLKCPITKEKIEEILISNNEQFKIGTIEDDIGLIPLEHILNISINYETDQKQDIFLEIKEVIGGTTEKGIPIAFITNVTEIPNLISAKTENIGYFKKITGRNLILFYSYDSEIDTEMVFNETQETILDKIHYKYNFRIQPRKFTTKISVHGNGTNVLLTYPQELDFTEEEKLIVRYIMNEPTSAKEMKLNQNSLTELDCRNLNKMKLCYVSKYHFKTHKSGVYYTTHLNHNNESSIYYESSPINVTLQFEININREGNERTIDIGDKGIIYLKSDYNDTEDNFFNDDDIEENTKFAINILFDNKISQNVSCHLWKNTENIVYIFCQLNENLDDGTHAFNMNRANFIYNKVQINIIPKFDFYLYINQIKTPLPFLYSKSQTININEETNTYTLNFKIVNYQNEKILISSHEYNGQIILDKCKKIKNELKCDIDKSEFYEIYTDVISLEAYYPFDNKEFMSFPMVDKFVVNYNLQRINLSVTIKNPAETYFDVDNCIAYEAETEPKDISNMQTEPFLLNCTSGDITSLFGCYFKKTNENPLYLICPFGNGTYSLSEKDNVTVITNIHKKYDFKIQPIKKMEKITIDGKSSLAMFIMEKTLDFGINDEIELDLMMEDPKDTQNIKINPNADKDLVCTDIQRRIKRCKVPKSHFENKQTGYYNIYHLNHKKKYIKFYEYPSIYVKLPTILTIKIKDIDDKNPAKIGQNGVISFLTDFEDPDNIFNVSDIEAKTTNETTFLGNNKDYHAVCFLWKPKEEKLRLICKFDKNIESQKIKLNEFRFDYGDYKIKMSSIGDLNIEQLDTALSFLYSDKQEINITDSTNEYNLVFKKALYNKEPLMLYKEDNNMKNIYLNCIEEEKEIKCPIKKDKLIGILSESGEKFCLSQFTESKGVLKFENVLDIIINYENVEKKNIVLSITKLLTKSVKKNSFIALETNTDEDIQIITTNYFNFTFNPNYVITCLLKKSNNQKDDKLLLLCQPGFPGDYQLDTNETRLEKINILYNFIIPATQISEAVTILKEEGTKIISVYPDSLNFESQDNLIIKYQTENPNKLNNIKLNKDSTTDLQCIDKTGYKECIVPKRHFKISGYYNTYYSNGLGSLDIFYEVPKIYIDISKIRINIIQVKDSITIGQKGVVLFQTDFDDPLNIFDAQSDIESILFNASFSDGKKNYSAKCHFWKVIGDRLRLICKFNEILENQKIKLVNCTFNYKEYTLNIEYQNELNIIQLNSTISFLYSDINDIDIYENSTEGTLVFKKEVYNKEPLILFSDEGKNINNTKSIYLNCIEEPREIKCSINTNKLLGILSQRKKEFYLSQLTESEGILKFENVNNIRIKSLIEYKKDIYLNITKLLTKKVEKNNYIVFETNITDGIGIITTDYFTLNPNIFANNELNCLFKKYTERIDDKLLLLCKADSSGEYTLNIEGKTLTEINVLYNFNIIKTEISETATVSQEEGIKIISVYPDSLNFTSQDNLIIKYQTDNPNKLNGIKLNKDSSTDLQCIDKKGYKECTVPQSHFKESGDYYTYYTNSLGDKVISYEIPKIQIILKKEDGGKTDGENTDEEKTTDDKGDGSNSKSLVGIIIGSVAGGLVLIVAIVLIIIRVKKKKANALTINSSSGNNILPNSAQVELVEGNNFE